MLKEFKEFAMRGSVVDMAVGIIIGATTDYKVYFFCLVLRTAGWLQSKIGLYHDWKELHCIPKFVGLDDNYNFSNYRR